MKWKIKFLYKGEIVLEGILKPTIDVGEESVEEERLEEMLFKAEMLANSTDEVRVHIERNG